MSPCWRPLFYGSVIFATVYCPALCFLYDFTDTVKGLLQWSSSVADGRLFAVLLGLSEQCRPTISVLRYDHPSFALQPFFATSG